MSPEETSKLAEDLYMRLQKLEQGFQALLNHLGLQIVQIQPRLKVQSKPQTEISNAEK